MDKETKEIIEAITASIKAFFCKDTALLIAQYAKDMTDGLIAQGFSREEALEITKVTLGWKGKN